METVIEPISVRPQDFATPTVTNAILREIVREQLARAPQQSFRGATPEPDPQPIFLNVGPSIPNSAESTVEYREVPTGASTTVAMYNADARRLPSGASSTVAMYNADSARRGMPSGDRRQVLRNFEHNSFCNIVSNDALRRIQQAIPMLDAKHASIIQAKLAKAGLTTANASHVDRRQISFKKAASIALLAERWVYQAQAAAAKSMAKKTKRCQHEIAGRRKRTREEKEAAYLARYGVPRGTKAERTARKRARAQL